MTPLQGFPVHQAENTAAPYNKVRLFHTASAICLPPINKRHAYSVPWPQQRSAQDGNMPARHVIEIQQSLERKEKYSILIIFLDLLITPLQDEAHNPSYEGRDNRKGSAGRHADHIAWRVRRGPEVLEYRVSRAQSSLGHAVQV